MKFRIHALAATALLGLGVFWGLSAERPLDAAAIPKHLANLENGKLIYTIGGCISCHAYR